LAKLVVVDSAKGVKYCPLDEVNQRSSDERKHKEKKKRFTGDTE